jgi:hypothetical protein
MYHVMQVVVQVAARTGAHSLGIELEEKRHTAALTVSYYHNIHFRHIMCAYTRAQSHQYCSATLCKALNGSQAASSHSRLLAHDCIVAACSSLESISQRATHRVASECYTIQY